MAPRAIISYDDTHGDHDALMLARIFADAGASLTLAYVRHCTQSERAQEDLEEQEAETLLRRGADWFSGLDVDTRIVVSPSTAEGQGEAPGSAFRLRTSVRDHDPFRRTLQDCRQHALTRLHSHMGCGCGRETRMQAEGRGSAR